MGLVFSDVDRDAHTWEHRDCQACSATDSMLSSFDVDFSSLTLLQAVPKWKTIRAQWRRLKPRTHETTDQYFKQLALFFGALALDRITPGHLREYQIARQANRMTIEDSSGKRDVLPWSKPAGASMVNHELSALQQLLKHAGLWAPLQPYYRPLAVPAWSPREVMSEQQEEHLFRVCAGREDVRLAYCVAAITNNTSAAGCELRGLRLKHLFLRQPTMVDGIDRTPSEFYVPPEAVKNSSRPRKIPMNPTTRWAFEYCYRRALDLGACEDEHFLFPFRISRTQYDPKRAASRFWIRDNWDKLRTVAGMPWLRPHDLRHQCITRMLERGIDVETVRAVAGHVTPKMVEYYSHIRVQAKLAAVMVIEPRYGKKQPVVASSIPARAALKG